jgi:hypothetical protein
LAFILSMSSSFTMSVMALKSFEKDCPSDVTFMLNTAAADSLMKPHRAMMTDNELTTMKRFMSPPLTVLSAVAPGASLKMWIVNRNGRRGGDRTHDLRLVRPLLSQLSYPPTPTKTD